MDSPGSPEKLTRRLAEAMPPRFGRNPSIAGMSSADGSSLLNRPLTISQWIAADFYGIDGGHDSEDQSVFAREVGACFRLGGLPAIGCGASLITNPTRGFGAKDYVHGPSSARLQRSDRPLHEVGTHTRNARFQEDPPTTGADKSHLGRHGVRDDHIGQRQRSAVVGGDFV